MDVKQEILLGSEKNIDSVNVDNYAKIELMNNETVMTEFTVNDVVNSTEVFDAEREENQVYRIYGRIEWMSLLNGLKTGYDELEDFFNPQSTDSKNIKDSFDFYLVAPHSGDSYGSIRNTDNRRRSFQVIASKDDIEIYNAGFSNNVYGEQTYGFNFKTDVDVSEYYDWLGFPLTEVFMYAQYKAVSGKEEMSRTSFSFTGNISKSNLTTKDLVVGDDVENYQGSNIQDVIQYLPEKYFQAQVYPQTFYIRTPYTDVTEKWLEWSYNPFIPLRLRYLDGVVSEAKAAEIVESTTTWDVVPTSGSANETLNLTKTLPQTLKTSTDTVEDWDDQTTSSDYDWDNEDGILILNRSGRYDITFTTQIYLPDGSDKYIAEIYLEQYLSSWNPIESTRRKFLITNSTQSFNYGRFFPSGRDFRVRVGLIPNPDERQMFRIPDYAKLITSKGKWVWRDILPQGYIDPITNEGVDYPFFNKRRYLFEPIVFDVIPNLNTDPEFESVNTQTVFNEIEYSPYASVIDQTPETELDDIEKPCQ